MELELFNQPLVSTAKEYALKCHESTNHLYDGKPYGLHLGLVVGYAVSFFHLIRADKKENVVVAAWCHDVIEDTRQTYNDVKKVIGEEAAEIVYALTNEKGRTRKERANEKYYRGILDTPGASFVKICDRLANIRYSKDTNSTMLAKYKLEQTEFYNWLYKSNYQIMFEKLNELFK